MTTWKDWGSQSRLGWTQEARGDAKYFGRPIYTRPSTLREFYDEGAAYFGRAHRAETIAATVNVALRGTLPARPYLSTTDGHDRYDGDGPPG